MLRHVLAVAVVLMLAACGSRPQPMGEGIWVAPRHLEQERAR